MLYTKSIAESYPLRANRWDTTTISISQPSESI